MPDTTPKIIVSDIFNDTILKHEPHIGEVKRPDVTYDVRLVAKKAPNGLYSVRHDYFVIGGDGPGIERAFGIVSSIIDRFNNYADYTLTFEQAVERLRNFEEKNASKGSNFSNTPKDTKHYSRFLMIA